MQTISQAITHARRQCPPIVRIAYAPYRMTSALEALTMIGRAVCPGFVLDADNRWVFENLIRWVHGDAAFECLDPDTRQVRRGNLNAGIYLAGNTGTGKTLALEVLDRYTTIDNVHLYADGTPVRLHWTARGTSDVCDAYQATGDLTPWTDRTVAAFNDLGAEPTQSIHMGNRVDVMRTIIERRADLRSRVTLLTSNYPLSALSTIYGDRVQSRLYEMCNYFELRGQDRRRV